MTLKRKKLSHVLFLSFVIMAATLCLSTFMVGAEEDDDDKALKGKVKIGAGYADEPDTFNISGISPGRAAEYLPAESSFLADLWLSYNKGKNYFQMESKFLTVDDFSAMVTGSMGERTFMVDLDLEKYTHRMDNNLLTDWSRPYSVSADTAAKELEMRVTVLNSEVRYKPESVPDSVLFFHMNIVERGGEKQARTLDHCYSCHVNTKTQELDQRTLTLIAGAEYAGTPFAVNYSFGFSSFEDGSSDLSYDYKNRFGNFTLSGNQPFAVVPDNEATSHKLAARYDVESNGTGYITFKRNDVENQTTGYSLESTSMSTRVFARIHEWITLKGQYDYRDESNSTPDAASRQFTRLAGVLTFRPDKQLKLEGRYRYDKLEREGGTEVAETTTKSLRLKALWRPGKNWRISGSHTFIDREDPFGRSVRNSFSRLDNVILSPYGTEKDVTSVMVIHTISPDSSCSANYYRSHSTGDTLGMEATLQNLSLGFNHSFDNGMGLYGNFFYYKNDYEKEIYLGVIEPFLSITPLPYEGEGNTYTIGAWGKLGDLSIRPGWSYTTTKSAFKDANLGGSVARNSTDVTINRFALQAGMPLSEALDINAGYYLDDYSDELQAQDNGKVQWFYSWIGYQF